MAVSHLSPYVRHRLISEREIVAAVLAVHTMPAAEKFIQEVLWRTYWKGWLELRPAVWRNFLTERDSCAPSGGMATTIAEAESGRTGIDGFDDWARELVAHGYLHNHARMWFASIWVFTLGLPWTLGADFFLRHLIDADPASNTLSWRWVAGLQTVGKTYLATADNIARNTGGRFSPRGLATTARMVADFAPLPRPGPLAPLVGYDPRVPSLLLITGEDCSAETLLPPDAAVRHVVSLGPDTMWPWGPLSRSFVTKAMDDVHERATARFGCEGRRATSVDAATLIALARGVGAQTIVTAFAPVGPVADALAEIAPILAAGGIPLRQVRRGWDDCFWPHATKGFFPFRERIPGVLADEFRYDWPTARS